MKKIWAGPNGEEDIHSYIANISSGMISFDCINIALLNMI
jgi:hypothetical protein